MTLITTKAFGIHEEHEERKNLRDLRVRRAATFVVRREEAMSALSRTVRRVSTP
jgi:hypothetical protein